MKEMKPLLALLSLIMVFVAESYAKLYWIGVLVYWMASIVDDADECNLPWYDDWDEDDDETEL